MAVFTLTAQQAADSTPYRGLLKEYELIKNLNPKRAFQIAAEIERMSRERDDLFFYADALFKKGVLHYFDSRYDSAAYYGQQSLNASRAANNYKSQMKADNLLGAIAYNRGDLQKAVDYYRKKAAVAAANKDTAAEMETFYNIGLVLFQQGEYFKSAETNFRALDYFERKRDTFNVFSSLHSIGYTYMHLEDLQGALHYFNRAAHMARLRRDKYSLTGVYIDMAELYHRLEKVDSCFYYIDQALKISAQEKDEFHFVIATNQKALLYLSQKNYSQGLLLAREAEKLDLRADRKLSLCETYETMALLFHASGQADSALKYAYKAFFIAKDQNKPTVLQTSTRILSGVYELRRNIDSSFKYYKLHSHFNDTLKKETQLRGIAQKEFSYEKQNQENLRHKEQLLATARLEKQKQISLIVLIASVLLAVFLLIGVVNYRQKQRANAQVLIQKKLLEEKNKEVKDSINYASRIQRSIMPDQQTQQDLLPNGFVLYLPKDVVSGDFYWINNVNAGSGQTHQLIAVADCTGHGVPGAFMSLIGVTILNQTLSNPSINSPAEALDFLNVQLPRNIKSSVTASIKDGMEISMCEIDREKMEILFAGASNNLYLVREGKIEMLQGDKRPIGLGYEGRGEHFTNRRVPVRKGDMLFMSSDGFPDQFGGEKGKKFKYRQMEELFVELAPLSPDEQKSILLKKFQDWKGELEQVDDVCVIGIRI